MRHFFKEYGYLALMGLCLVCSAVLLGSVLADRPLVAIAGQHLPVLRVEGPAREEAPSAKQAQEAATPGTVAGYLLTEDFLEERLAAFLPEDFPAEDLDVSFDSGMVTLSFAMDRTGLKTYLQSRCGELGTKRNLLLQMLPRRLELEGRFALSADGEGLHLTPICLAAGEKAFPLNGLPEDVFSALDTGMNALLENAGVHFSAAEFVDGGILLK